MARLSKEDWLKEGFKVLSEFAQHKLRILYLCERLGVTRGSFYHHFESIEDYIEQLMQSWEQQNTLQLIELANTGEGPKERFQKLNEMVISLDQSIETAIRSWSLYHPSVGKSLQKVDDLRLKYLEGLFAQLGLGTEEAQHRATLEYAILIGIQQLFPRYKEEQLAALFQVYQQYFSASTKP